MKNIPELIQKLEESSTLQATKSLISMDLYFLNEKYDKAIEAIQILQDYTQDDFLDFYKANVYFEMGDFENTEKYYQQFADNYPYSYEGYENLIAFYILQEKPELVIDQLNKLVEFTDLEKDEVVDYMDEAYTDFTELDIYQEWKNKK